MSDESHKFTSGRTPKFPALILRAFTGPEQHAEWILTPPDNAGWFTYNLEAKQENGVLFINFDRSIMMPKEPG